MRIRGRRTEKPARVATATNSRGELAESPMPLLTPRLVRRELEDFDMIFSIVVQIPGTYEDSAIGGRNRLRVGKTRRDGADVGQGFGVKDLDPGVVGVGDQHMPGGGIDRHVFHVTEVRVVRTPHARYPDGSDVGEGFRVKDLNPEVLEVGDENSAVGFVDGDGPGIGEVAVVAAGDTALADGGDVGKRCRIAYLHNMIAALDDQETSPALIDGHVPQRAEACVDDIRRQVRGRFLFAKKAQTAEGLGVEHVDGAIRPLLRRGLPIGGQGIIIGNQDALVRPIKGDTCGPIEANSIVRRHTVPIPEAGHLPSGFHVRHDRPIPTGENQPPPVHIDGDGVQRGIFWLLWR